MATLSFRPKKSFPLIQNRSYESLPLQVIKLIDMLTLDPKYPPKIVGSYKYVVHEYPNDIDLFEFYEGCCGFDEVKNKVINRFKEIIQDINTKPLTYLGDFKAGIDKRYDINIGKISHDKIYDYNSNDIKDNIRKLFDDGLLTKEEVTLWLRNIYDNPNMNQYIELKNLIHDKCVVRWTAKDIEEGYKKLPKGSLLSFEEALTQKSIIKIDIWTYLSGRYIEMTNWYAITYLEQNNSKPQYMSSPIDNYEFSLKKDLAYYKNPSLRKYMKYAKRLWNYYVLKNMKSDMIRLYPLFSSGAAKMYQIMGEIETIVNILENISKPDMESIKNNIEDWKTRLGTLMNNVLPTDLSNKIFVKVNDILREKSKKLIISQILDIKSILELEVNKYVKNYFKKTNYSDL